jgi:hypothetical protein
LTGQESKSDFFKRNYPQYEAIKFINELPAPRKVFYEHAVPDGFYLDGTAAYHYSPYTLGLLGKDAASIHNVLRQKGITHVLVAQNRERSSVLSSRESEFTRLYLRRMYHRNAFIVYELLANSIKQEAVYYDFLQHLQEARESPKPSGENNTIVPKGFAVGGDARYSMVIVPPSEVAFPVRIPGHASLSFAAARGNQGCHEKGAFQVWIDPLDTDRRLVYELDLEGRENGKWIENKVDLAEYANRNVNIIFKNDERLGCTDYYWADPVLINPNNVPRSRKSSEKGKEFPETGLMVSSGRVSPSQAPRGQGIEVSFSGPALTADTYFDILVREPGSLIDMTILNYQQGASARHTIPASTKPGTWVITGVRAHRWESDHEEDFHQLWIPFNVTR